LDYRVKLRQSGREFSAAADETVLEAAIREGAALPYSCRNGECGSCKARLLSGSVAGGEGDALTTAERSAGFILLCRARPSSDLELLTREERTPPVVAVRTLPARVARLERLAHDVMGLWLSLPSTQSFDYRAGQYLDLLLPDGGRRSFSMAGRPVVGALLELHIRRVPDGRFTGRVFEEMRAGDLLRLRGPFGTMFWQEQSPRPVLMLAGGTGFAPIKAMLEQAIADNTGRAVHLYRGVRSRRDLYLAELPESWVGRLAQFRYVPVLSEPRPEDGWQGRTGNVHRVALADIADLSAFEVCAAGPPPMIKAVRNEFSRAGVPEAQLHCDAFEFQD
jgi:CDP-4-dehydro-6-deoxyglucose reductase